jgi:hypothetical protein
VPGISPKTMTSPWFWMKRIALDASVITSMLVVLPVAACSVYTDIPSQRGDSPIPGTDGAGGVGGGSDGHGGTSGTSGEGGGAGVGGSGGAAGTATRDASADRGTGAAGGIGGHAGVVGTGGNSGGSGAGAGGNAGRSGAGGVSSGGGAGTIVIDSGPGVDGGGAAGAAGSSGGTAGSGGSDASAGAGGGGSTGSGGSAGGGGGGASGGSGGSGGAAGADAGSQDAPPETGGVCATGACKRVFVSSSSPAATGAFGGLASADAFCQSAANTKQLGGSWKAWLSTSGTSASSRLLHATVPYRLLDGATVAANWAGLTSGGLSHAINVTEAGVVLPSGTILEVWTGTTTAGAYSGDTCNGWTDGSATPTAEVGLTSESGSGWTAKYRQFCDRTNIRLYCFEQ